jgi:hypothetical protein
MRSEEKEKSTPTLLLKRMEYSLETRQLDECERRENSMLENAEAQRRLK